MAPERKRLGSGRKGRWIPGGPYGLLGGGALVFLSLVLSPWPVLPANQEVEEAEFHHLHLNVVDPDSTIAFYQTYFGAYPVEYRDRTPALFTERSFILMNRVSVPPRSNVGTALWHVGWSGVVGEAEFEWRVEEGIDVQTPLTPLGENAYMYFWGPDQELIEIYTGNRNHRFEHFHLMVSNREETADWFERQLGLERPGPSTSVLVVDNVNFILTEISGPSVSGRPVWYPDDLYPEGTEPMPTDGRAIDHIGFSYPEIDPVLERMSATGVEIVRPIRLSADHGHRSFFVRAPDGLLVEIVEARPIPEGLWSSKPADERSDTEVIGTDAE